MSKTPITIKVDVQPALAGNGNCSGGRYQAICDQEGITVHDKNIQINYVLSPATPNGIVFSGFTASPTGQLTPPSISPDGRSMTTNDLDTRAGVIKVNLEFRDNSVFVLDPEVTNDPVDHLTTP
jgi:hypothetical protein